MSTQAEKLLRDAMKLSDQDRADLAAKLIDSLDAESEDGVQAAWEKEIGDRLDALDQGKAKTIPWQEARRRIVGGGDAATEP